ncbi:hypothetical protein MTO96_006407 [Rhipicephalus appendiculatus]
MAPAVQAKRAHETSWPQKAQVFTSPHVLQRYIDTFMLDTLRRQTSLLLLLHHRSHCGWCVTSGGRWLRRPLAADDGEGRSAAPPARREVDVCHGRLLCGSCGRRHVLLTDGGWREAARLLGTLPR